MEWNILLRLKNSKSLKPLKKIGKSSKRGTQITFLPSKEIFSTTKFSSTVLQKRMRELAFLNKGISLTLVDKTQSKIKKYDNKFDGGILNLFSLLIKKSQFYQ